MTKYEVEWTAKKRAATSCLTYWISTRSRCRVCSIFCCWSNLPFGEVLDIHFRLCDSLMSPKKKTNTMSLSFSVVLLLLPSIFFFENSAWPRVKTARHCEIYFLSRSLMLGFFPVVFLVPQFIGFLSTRHTHKTNINFDNTRTSHGTRPRNQPNRHKTYINIIK